MKYLNSPDELASLIRFHRKRAGLSQIDLAAMCGVSRKVVQGLEAGNEGTSWRNLMAVLEVLNIRLLPDGPLVDEWVSAAQESSADEDAS